MCKLCCVQLWATYVFLGFDRDRQKILLDRRETYTKICFRQFWATLVPICWTPHLVNPPACKLSISWTFYLVNSGWLDESASLGKTGALGENGLWVEKGHWAEMPHGVKMVHWVKIPYVVKRSIRLKSMQNLRDRIKFSRIDAKFISKFVSDNSEQLWFWPQI